VVPGDERNRPRGHRPRNRDVFDRYNFCSEDDGRHAAELLSNRLDVAMAFPGGES